MDNAAHRLRHPFPGFTTAELKARVAYVTDAATKAKMLAEIARRKAATR